MKKLLAVLLSLMLMVTAMVFAAAEAVDGGVLTWEELDSWSSAMKQRAVGKAPLNDPTEEAAHSEDGYCLIYDFAYFYCDRPEMTDETVINEIVVYSPDVEGPRGTLVDMPVSTLLGRFYTENETLDGSFDGALIYYSEMLPQEAGYGVVYRDGQRIQVVQYTVHDQFASGGDGYTNAGIIYTVDEDEVSAIRLYGLSDRISEDAVRADQSEALKMDAVHGYSRVPTSTDGTKLSMFSLDDLTFDHFDLLSATPETVEAHMETIDAEDSAYWVEENGSWTYTMLFENCTMTFRTNADKKDPRWMSLLILEDGMEGPRGVRVGDTLNSVMRRFRNDDTIWTEGAYTMLYGQKDVPPYGKVTYGDDASATLCYVVADEAGVPVTLEMNFEMYMLTDISLYREY